MQPYHAFGNVLLSTSEVVVTSLLYSSGLMSDKIGITIHSCLILGEILLKLKCIENV